MIFLDPARKPREFWNFFVRITEAKSGIGAAVRETSDDAAAKEALVAPGRWAWRRFDRAEVARGQGARRGRDG